jgi:hypothetical protein
MHGIIVSCAAKGRQASKQGYWSLGSYNIQAQMSTRQLRNYGKAAWVNDWSDLCDLGWYYVFLCSHSRIKVVAIDVLVREPRHPQGRVDRLTYSWAVKVVVSLPDWNLCQKMSEFCSTVPRFTHIHHCHWFQRHPEYKSICSRGSQASLHIQRTSVYRSPPSSPC